ncbi:MAG: hypothetical protein O3B13_22015 [Planctomycetota bacterium]|nr:hypothetical protein [Planctomycetota bacterium]
MPANRSWNSATLLWLLILTAITINPSAAEDEQSIPAALAISRLNALKSRHAIVVLQDADRRIHVQCARVRPGGTAQRVYFDRHLLRLPGHELTIAAEYRERQLERPAGSGRQTPDPTGQVQTFRYQQLQLSGGSVTANGRQFVVLHLQAVEFDAPEVKSHFLYRAVRLDPERDPWQTSRGGGPSAWVIRFGPPDKPDQFEYRLTNPAHYPNPRIDSVVMHDAPEWVYDRDKQIYRPGVVFTVSHIGQGPVTGHFLLDDDGFPTTGSFRGGLERTIDARVQAGIRTLRESALNRRQSQTTNLTAIDGESTEAASNGALRYELNSGSCQVVTTRTSRVAGSISRSAVDVDLKIEEHLRATIQRDDEGAVTLTLSPERYIVESRTSAGGREVGRETFDSALDTPAPRSLSHFHEQSKPLLGKRFVYSVSSRGLLRPLSDSIEESQFDLFRRVQCRFLAPWLPLLPSEPGSGTWRETVEYGNTRRAELVWQLHPQGTDDEAEVFRLQGVGELRNLRSGDGSAQLGGLRKTSVSLRAKSLLPVEMSFQIDDVPTPRSLQITRSRHRVQETVRWEREDVSNVRDENGKRVY